MEKNRRQSLTWEQKFAIINELEKRRNQNKSHTVDEIGRWAKQKFNLQKIPHRNTILRIKSEKDFLKKSVNEGKLKRKNRIFVSSNSEETAITSWIWDMYERKVFISDELIQEKARRIQLLLNQHILQENQLHLKFSNGGLQKMKARNNFKCYRYHGESGNIDQNVICAELPILRKKNKNYSLRIFEMQMSLDFFYQMPTRDTITSARIPGRKKRE